MLNTSLKTLNSSTIENKSNSNQMIFKTFKTKFNSKEGGTEWNKVNRHLWKKRSVDQLKELNEDLTGINYAVPCGLVNKIVVVDMDLYKLKGQESEFIKEFGEDYVKLFNTFTVKTTSGGEHLYFEWDKEIKQTTCATHEIDIRNTGGYVIAPGSSINGKEYKLINDTTVKKCPENLKNWLLLNIYRQPRTIKVRVKKDKEGQVVNPACKNDLIEQDEVDLSSYNYIFSDTVLRSILDSLPEKYFTNYEDYLILTTCLKTLNKEKIWIEYIEKKVEDKHKKLTSSWGYANGDAWDSCKYKSCNTLPLILRESGFMQGDIEPDTLDKYFKYNSEQSFINAKNKLYEYLNTCNEPKWGKPFTTDPITFLKKSVELRPFYDRVVDLIQYDLEMDLVVKKFLGYYMYKPTNNHTIKPDRIIENQQYLDGDTPGSFLTQNTERYVVCKSDTGTGKTTAMKNYLNINEEPFTSIVSRLSLGKEQDKIFTISGLKSNWFKDYEDNIWSMEGDNMVIQIDSLSKICDWDFTGYTIYLDEFNSLVEYFIDCPTLNDKRVMVKSILERIIHEGERVIMTDAHISDTSLMFLNQLGLHDMVFIENKYKHNKGIKATEMYSDTEVIEELQSLIDNDKPFMVCCDSKNVADVIHKKLKGKESIGLFTSETTADINLDDYKQVIFSPKVVYGLDSLMERPVYCVMKEHTITPDGMLQQANRCRKITELKYFFARKSHGLYKYNNEAEVYDTLTARENNCLKIMECITTPEESEKYKKLLAHHLYHVDCLNTNKFAHFLQLLKGQGFNVDIDRKLSTNQLQKYAKEVKEMKLEELNEIYKQHVEKYEAHRDDKLVYIKEELLQTKESIEKSIIHYGESEYDTQELLLTNIKLSNIGSGDKGDPYLNTHKEELLQSTPYPTYIKNNVKLLRIQPLDVEKYGDIIIDNHKIAQHYLICKYFFKEESEVIDSLEKNKEYMCKKGDTTLLKMFFLRKVLSEVGITDIYNLYPEDYNMSEEKNKSLLEEYNIVFNNRSKKVKIAFDEPSECIKVIVKMYKNIFGTKIISSKKTTKIVNKIIKCITVYEMNMGQIDMSKEIYDKSKQSKGMYDKIKY